ncbi:MAG: hypothetical protein ACO2O2_04730 [Acidilobaceae archaeon]
MVSGFPKKKGISIVVVSVIALTLGSLVALASGYIPLSNYASASGNYVYVWSYVRGDAELDEFGCFTGWIFNVWGAGGGFISSPASGSISVSTPPAVVFNSATTVTVGEAFIDGRRVGYARDVAWIFAPSGAC